MTKRPKSESDRRDPPTSDTASNSEASALTRAGTILAGALKDNARAVEDGQRDLAREWARACAGYVGQTVDAHRLVVDEVVRLQQQLHEALAATAGNEAAQRCREAQQHLQDAVTSLSVEREHEKNAADEQLMASLRGLQGDPNAPNAHQLAQEAYQRYRERLQTLNLSESSVKVQHALTEVQSRAREATELAHQLAVQAWRNYYDGVQQALSRYAAENQAAQRALSNIQGRAHERSLSFARQATIGMLRAWLEAFEAVPTESPA